MICDNVLITKYNSVVDNVRLCSSACSPWGYQRDHAEDFCLSAVSSQSQLTDGSMIIGSMMGLTKDINREIRP